MPHQVLFIQGGGAEGTHDDWDNKLVEHLGRELGRTMKSATRKCRTKPTPSMRAGR